MNKRTVHVIVGSLLLCTGPLASQDPPTSAGDGPTRQLRVCADPNNLPYSNEAEEGFENRLAELVADELDARVSYTWWPLRRGFIRNTLRENRCDVVMGLPSAFELVLATRPYYRSTYVFVYRGDRNYDIDSLDDPDLRELKIGVHVIGDDYANSPPAHALGERGLIENVVGYSVYGDYQDPNPPGEIVEAVASEEVDVAIVWGPIAGFFAKQKPVELALVPVTPQIDLPFLPMVYDVSMGVRRADTAFVEELNGVIVRRWDDIQRILAEYGVPALEPKRRAPPRN